MDGQAHGPAPFLGNDPEVALIAEYDFPIGNVREAYQSKRFTVSSSNRKPGEEP